MDNSKHLWNPISIRAEQTLRISHALALEHLDMYLDNASIGGAGTFSDQNTAAQLVRLQAGLRDEQVRRVQDTPAARNNEEIAAEAVGPEKSSKKRRRERKLQEAQNGAAADSSIVDVTTGEADVEGSSQPAKKKRKDKSKSKVKLESSQSAQQ